MKSPEARTASHWVVLGLAAAGMVLATAVLPARAGGPLTPDWVRKQQGDAPTTSQVSLPAATSTTVAAVDGDRRALTICNIGANSVYCGHTTPATTANGQLLVASGYGCWTDDDSARAAHYCISSSGSTVAVTSYK